MGTEFSNTPRYIVETLIGNTWENVWSEVPQNEG